MSVVDSAWLLTAEAWPANSSFVPDTLCTFLCSGLFSTVDVHDYPIEKGCSVSQQVLLLLSNPSKNVLRAQLLHLQAEGERPYQASGPHWLGLLPFQLSVSV